MVKEKKKNCIFKLNVVKKHGGSSMKTSAIIFACATLASFAFLACNMNNMKGCAVGSAAQVAVLSKTCNEDRCWYDESDSVYFLPHDPNWLRIDESVKEWMEEQLATESNDTRLFIIVDFFIHENYVNTLGISGPTEYEYYIDGVRVTYEEYMVAAKRNEEYSKERAARGKRNLPIPKEGIIGETDYYWWGVPMTAKEIAELTENYKEIAIEFYSETISMNDYNFEGLRPGGDHGYIGNGDVEIDDYGEPDC
jgi:hypothetical protein